MSISTITTKWNAGRFIKNHWDRLVLVLILITTGILTFYSIGNEGYGNEYYAATVKSMLQNWHNFFFASFDPSGYVTVDKPALGLWLQAVSAFVFGYHGWSLILPEMLSTLVSIAVLFHLVKRYFGRVAGVMSAFALGITPILVAVSRTNNLDASLLMLLMLATWALVIAAERGSLGYLVLSMIFIGFGFNVKMLQAFMILPALYAVYLFTAPLRIRIKVAHLAGATAVLMTVSLLWAVIVDLTPANNRPYIGSSNSNSVIELALGYNGIQRITGTQNSGSNAKNGNFGIGMPQMPASQDQTSVSNIKTSNSSGASSNSNASNSTANSGTKQSTTQQNNSQSNASQQNNGFKPGQGFPQGTSQQDGGQQNGAQQPPFDGQNSLQGNGSNGFRPDRMNGNGGPGGESENGTKGALRIFNEQLSGQIAWLLPLAFFGALILGFGIVEKRKLISNEATQENQFNQEKFHKAFIMELRSLLLWAGWIIPMLCYFSIAGFFHRYYLSMLAPGIAALVGIGIVQLWKAYLSSGFKWILLPTALASTAAVQALILSRYSEWSLLIPIVCGLTALAAFLLIIIRLTKKDHLTKTIQLAIAAGFLALMISPAIWAATPLIYGSQTQLPIAGPELNRDSRSMAGPFGGGISIPNGPTAFRNSNKTSNSMLPSSLVSYLAANKGTEKFLLAVSDIGTAESIIINTGLPVIAIGGFSGNDKIMTLAKLKEMVAKGELRYFMLGGRGMGSQSDITQWVISNSKVVTLDSGSTTQDSGINGDRLRNSTIYDLKKTI